MASRDVRIPTEVAEYLIALNDPRRMMDPDTISTIQDRLDTEDLDPATRLDLLLRLRSLHRVDLDSLQAAFIKAVPGYVADYGLELADVREDFAAVGVPDHVLDAITARVTRRTEGASSKVTVEDVAAHVLGRRGTFTNKDVIAATGASRNTVAKAMKQLIADKQVKAKHGRPITYSVA